MLIDFIAITKCLISSFNPLMNAAVNMETSLRFGFHLLRSLHLLINSMVWYSLLSSSKALMLLSENLLFTNSTSSDPNKYDHGLHYILKPFSGRSFEIQHSLYRFILLWNLVQFKIVMTFGYAISWVFTFKTRKILSGSLDSQIPSSPISIIKLVVTWALSIRWSLLYPLRYDNELLINLTNFMRTWDKGIFGRGENKSFWERKQEISFSFQFHSLFTNDLCLV